MPFGTHVFQPYISKVLYNEYPYLNMIRPASAGIRGENTALCQGWM